MRRGGASRDLLIAFAIGNLGEREISSPDGSVDSQKEAIHPHSS
jgi:hypothetical protein